MSERKSVTREDIGDALVKVYTDAANDLSKPWPPISLDTEFKDDADAIFDALPAPLVTHVEAAIRAAALDAWMPVWRALQAACADCRSPGESRTVNGFSCSRHRPLYLAAIDALREGKR